MKKKVKVILTVTTIVIIIWAISVIINLYYMLDTEAMVKWQMKKDTGLIIPDQYEIIQSHGTVFSDSIRYVFQFEENEFRKLKENLFKTLFYKDTAKLREYLTVTGNPSHEKIAPAIQGLWMETDTTYYFLPLARNISGMHMDIEFGEIDKKRKTLTVVPGTLRFDEFIETR